MSFHPCIELLKLCFGYVLYNRTLISCTLVLMNNGDKSKKGV